VPDQPGTDLVTAVARLLLQTRVAERPESLTKTSSQG
jgi:hypothetical protein